MGIAGGKAERLLYVSFGFNSPTDKKLRDPDICVRVGQIPIQR
jgi:hypothetical protein